MQHADTAHVGILRLPRHGERPRLASPWRGPSWPHRVAGRAPESGDGCTNATLQADCRRSPASRRAPASTRRRRTCGRPAHRCRSAGEPAAMSRDAIVKLWRPTSLRNLPRVPRVAALTYEPAREFEALPVFSPNPMPAFSLHTKPSRRGQSYRVVKSTGCWSSSAAGVGDSRLHVTLRPRAEPSGRGRQFRVPENACARRGGAQRLGRSSVHRRAGASSVLSSERKEGREGLPRPQVQPSRLYVSLRAGRSLKRLTNDFPKALRSAVFLAAGAAFTPVGLRRQRW